MKSARVKNTLPLAIDKTKPHKPGRALVTCNVETITPAKAAAMLKRNNTNRNIRETHVRALADEILAGRWQITPDAISVDWAGEITNGQHRLMAIVTANVSVTALVARGVDPSSREVTDGGIVRSARDQHNITAPNDRISNLEAGVARIVEMMSGPNIRVRRQTLHGLREVRKRFAAGFAAVRPAMGGIRISGIGRVGVLAAFVVAHASAPSLVEASLRQLIDGAGLAEGDPILVLRNRLLAIRQTGGALTGFGREAMDYDRTLLALAAKIDGNFRRISKVPEGGAIAARERFMAANKPATAPRSPEAPPKPPARS